MTQTIAENPLRAWLLSHDAFRRDARGLRGALAALEPSDHQAVAELASCFAWTEGMLTFHHEAEDDRLWPRLSRFAPDFGLQAPRFRADHLRLDLLQTSVRDGLAALEVAPTSSAARSIHRQVSLHAAALEAHLGDHLAREEMAVQAVAERSLTPAELASVMKEARGRAGTAQLWHGLPWVVSAAKPAQRRALIVSLPTPLRWALRAAEPSFVRRFGPILRHGRPSARHDHPSMWFRTPEGSAGRGL